MELSEELLAALRPITIKLFYRLFRDEFPKYWAGELTLNQIRVNNSIFTRGTLEGQPSSMTDIAADLQMPRTTVNRALAALAQHFSPEFPERQIPYVEERVDPEDQRKKLYGFTEEAKQNAYVAVDILTQLIADTVSQMAPVLRKHGIVLNDAELMTFVTDEIPRLVREHLASTKDS